MRLVSMQAILRAVWWSSLFALVGCSRTYTPNIQRTDDSVDRGTVCPVTRLNARYYRDVAKQSVPDEIGGRSCVVDANAALEAEAQCAQQANTAAFDAALAERGLVATDHQGWGSYLSTPQAGEQSVGQVLDLGPDDQNNFDAARAVFLGWAGDDDGCSGTSTLAAPPTGAFIARDGGGRLVVVVPKPSVESRNYVTCTCFGGCGAQPPGPQPLFAPLGPGEVISETVEVPFSAIRISTSAVESQTCCCAP